LKKASNIATDIFIKSTCTLYETHFAKNTDILASCQKMPLLHLLWAQPPIATYGPLADPGMGGRIKM